MEKNGGKESNGKSDIQQIDFFISSNHLFKQ
jgi:hypothetical protein